MSNYMALRLGRNMIRPGRPDKSSYQRCAGWRGWGSSKVY